MSDRVIMVGATLDADLGLVLDKSLKRVREGHEVIILRLSDVYDRRTAKILRSLRALHEEGATFLDQSNLRATLGRRARNYDFLYSGNTHFVHPDYPLVLTNRTDPRNIRPRGRTTVMSLTQETMMFDAEGNRIDVRLAKARGGVPISANQNPLYVGLGCLATRRSGGGYVRIAEFFPNGGDSGTIDIESIPVHRGSERGILATAYRALEFCLPAP